MDTPFQHYLGTNYVSSTEEIKQIKAYLSIKEKQLVETQLSLEQLTRKRDRLRQLVGSYRALISPARRLPDDLIQEIFLRCLPPRSNAVIGCSRDAPIKLTQICSAWRDIAVSLPQLWSSIHIPYENSIMQMAYHRSETLQLWLQRSGSYPLSVSVSTYRGDLFNADIIDIFSRHLFSVSNRWKIFYLQAIFPILEKLEELSLNNLHNLKKLEICGEPNDGRTSVDASKSILWQAPNLRKLTTKYTEDFLDLPLRWGRFTELDFASQLYPAGIPPARVLWLLSQTTNLVKFNFVLDKGEDCNMSTPPVVLKNLKYLGVHTNGLHIILFQKLQLPNLKHITYIKRFFRTDVSIATSHSILPLLHSGSTVSSVESLYISDQSLTSELCQIILLLVPRILRLSIDFNFPVRNDEKHYPDLCLRLLIPPSDQSQWLAPLLERLIIKGCYFSKAAVLDVACARSLKRGPLHVVRSLFRGKEAYNNIEEELSVLQSRRLKIQLKHKGNYSYIQILNTGLLPPSWFDEEDEDDGNESGNR